MSLVDIMIEQIGSARTIVEDGAEVIPAWRINTPEGSYLVFTRFDHDKPEHRERVLLLVSRFMTWKMAMSFLLTAETWLVSGGNARGRRGATRHRRFAPRAVGAGAEDHGTRPVRGDHGDAALSGLHRRMDVATLYMIVTLKEFTALLNRND